MQDNSNHSKEKGVIDTLENPFVRNSWVQQGYGLTNDRPDCLEKLFGMTIQAIKQSKPINENAYPAFVGIRWGFARIESGILLATDKWLARHSYDAWGNPRSSNTQTRPQKAKDSSVTASRPTKAVEPDLSSARPFDTTSILRTSKIIALRNELERRRQLLIAAAEDLSVTLAPVERRHILEYLRDGQLPRHPQTTSALLRELVSSALSINQPPFRIRSRLKKILGDIPLADTIGHCLATLLHADSLSTDEAWDPVRFQSILVELRETQPRSDAFSLHVINTSVDCGSTLELWVANGLEAFYRQVDTGLSKGPEAAWSFMQELSRPIHGVGPVLIADFLKNSGFHRLVKLDQRLEREFPALLNKHKNLDSRRMFIEAWHLADQLGMEPFVLDHLLYQWGNTHLKQHRI
jgi:hypothetical protein